MRSPIAVLVGAVACFVSSPTFVRAEGFWQVQGTTAYVATDIVNAAKPNVVATFLVSFDPRLACGPEIGVTLTEGRKLDKPKGQQWMEEPMVVSVDGKYTFSEKSVLTKYANGFEVTFLGPQEILDRLKAGSYVHAKIPGEMPTFGFPLGEASAFIVAAQTACRTK
jgi:hypothetical protein